MCCTHFYIRSLFFFYFRNFESCLINSGKGLNVAVSPMYPVISCVIERRWHAHDIQKEIIGIFNKIKNENFELVVVVIPDFPSGIYGNYLYNKI